MLLEYNSWRTAMTLTVHVQRTPPKYIQYICIYTRRYIYFGLRQKFLPQGAHSNTFLRRYQHTFVWFFTVFAFIQYLCPSQRYNIHRHQLVAVHSSHLFRWSLDHSLLLLTGFGSAHLHISIEYRLHSGYARSLWLVHSAFMHFCDFLLIVMQLVFLFYFILQR